MFKVFGGQTDSRPRLADILEGYDLPSFGGIYMEALGLVRDVDSSTEKLADVLATDPGLTANLLRTVNSAAFGLRSEITSVHHAVSMLGRGHVESMLVSFASHDALPSDPCNGFEPDRFWKTAARRAATARALAERVSPAEWSECFTAALLSDMAIPVLCLKRGGEYTRLVESWHQGAGELQDLELEAFGWDHTQVAALMCAEWRFPEVIAQAIASHHGLPGHPDATAHPLEPVNVAMLIREVDEARGVAELVERAHATLGLAEDDIRGLVDESFHNAEEIAAQFV